MTASPTDAAEHTLQLALARPPRLGRTRVVCVDGPAGSGKTTFADALVAAARERAMTTALVPMDDLYAGWGGLHDAGRRVHDQVVAPLAVGIPAGYERYDWHQQRFTDHIPVPATDLLVIEGVGSGDPSYAERVSVLVWVWAPTELRLERWLGRDGAAAEPYWRRWMADEDRLHDKDCTAQRADLVVDGRSGAISPDRSAGA